MNSQSCHFIKQALLSKVYSNLVIKFLSIKPLTEEISEGLRVVISKLLVRLLYLPDKPFIHQVGVAHVCLALWVLPPRVLSSFVSVRERNMHGT